MKKITMISLAVSLAFFGCAAPKPVELDGGANITLNHSIIAKRHYGIQKDEFLRQNNWTYNIVLYKNGDELVPDYKIVKTFYLAHNADHIIIVGSKKLTNEYRTYFLQNQVKARIELKEVDFINDKKVNILFFHNKNSENTQEMI